MFYTKKYKLKSITPKETLYEIKILFIELNKLYLSIVVNYAIALHPTVEAPFKSIRKLQHSILNYEQIFHVDNVALSSCYMFGTEIIAWLFCVFFFFFFGRIWFTV